MNRKGMTIMELMVAMVLSAIAFSLIWGTYSFYTGSISKFSQRREQHRDMTYSVDFLCTELRTAREIVLIVPDSCKYISSRGDSILFTFSNDTLYRKREKDSIPLAFKLIDSLLFTLPETEDSVSKWKLLTIRAQIEREMKLPQTYYRSIVIPYTAKEEWF